MTTLSQETIIIIIIQTTNVIEKVEMERQKRSRRGNITSIVRLAKIINRTKRMMNFKAATTIPKTKSMETSKKMNRVLSRGISKSTHGKNVLTIPTVRIIGLNGAATPRQSQRSIQARRR
jgi:hypothetical protein